MRSNQTEPLETLREKVKRIVTEHDFSKIDSGTDPIIELMKDPYVVAVLLSDLLNDIAKNNTKGSAKT